MKRTWKATRRGSSFGPLTDAPFDVPAFLAQPLVARLATDGPVVRPVWYLWEDESFWVFTGSWSRLPDRLARNPAFELVVDVCDPGTGLTRQVVASGRGRTVAFDTARARRKLVRYLGPDESRWDARFALSESTAASGALWARLDPDVLRVADLSFTPSAIEAGTVAAHD
ncbi:pyridoxamine 5'-phosphate oxidase family protein [Streptomyces sp. NPDC048644]|uniref:pyridoxamine 5'-phosphate oxidase family protein n=1 Tax=Streptomyces sp. NPDC048644 TaxID=3365582 RepID=UPI003719ABE5